MDKAIFNGKIVSAYEISLDYSLEKAVRIASRNRQLKCVDPLCKNPVLKYCHGDKKQAYFAHIVNTECDYDTFDKTDTEELKALRNQLAMHFASLGFSVQTEVKLLPHHYSPLFCTKGDCSFAIETGTAKTTTKQYDNLMAEYAAKGICAQWIVLGEEPIYFKENGISFLKRCLLNESETHDCILLDDGTISQYRLDTRHYALAHYNDTYDERAPLEDLRVENGFITIGGYNERFADWQQSKQKDIDDELAKRESLARKQALKRQQKLEHQQELERQQELKRQQKLERRRELEQAKQPAPSCQLLEQIAQTLSPSPTAPPKQYSCTECGIVDNRQAFYLVDDKNNVGICNDCAQGLSFSDCYKKLKEWR